MFFLSSAQLSPLWESIVESVRMQTGGSPWAWLALIGFVHPIICPIVAHRRGHSARLWFAHGMIFGFFATITVFMLPNKPRREKSSAETTDSIWEMSGPPSNDNIRRKYVRFAI